MPLLEVSKYSKYLKRDILLKLSVFIISLFFIVFSVLTFCINNYKNTLITLKSDIDNLSIKNSVSLGQNSNSKTNLLDDLSKSNYKPGIIYYAVTNYGEKLLYKTYHNSYSKLNIIGDTSYIEINESDIKEILFKFDLTKLNLKGYEYYFSTPQTHNFDKYYIFSGTSYVSNNVDKSLTTVILKIDLSKNEIKKLYEVVYKSEDPYTEKCNPNILEIDSPLLLSEIVNEGFILIDINCNLPNLLPDPANHNSYLLNTSTLKIQNLKAYVSNVIIDPQSNIIYANKFVNGFELDPNHNCPDICGAELIPGKVIKLNLEI